MACGAFLLLLGLSFIAAVNCQSTCFQTNGCGGTNVAVSTANADTECCRRVPMTAGNPMREAQGMSYQDPGGACMPCPLRFGFGEPTFSGSETGAAYILPVGFYSGPVPGDAFFITVTLELIGTSDSDIKLNTPRADFGGSVPFVSVTMSLIPDNIAQEMNETFAITIAPGNAAATQVLSSYTIQSRINGTSIDSDRASFQLSQADYSNIESARVIQARIQKDQDKRLANSVTFRITPLTVVEAISRNLSVPAALLALMDASDFLSSPPYAVDADFNTTIFNVVFPADELTNRVPGINVPIGIVDDDINERFEQNFLITTAVIEAVNPQLINNTGRDISIGRILDDDPLVIGFERSVYTFDEPRGFAPNRDIRLVKEDDRTTEQTFEVVIGLASAPNFTAAIQPFDFLLNSRGTQTLTSAEQFFQVFLLLRGDTGFEGEEAFVITSSPPASAILQYSQPTVPSSGTTFRDTTVILRDSATAVIGFEQESYTVSEQDGAVEVCVNVTVPGVTQQFTRTGEVVLGVRSVSGSADAADYTPTTPSTTNVTFMSSGGNEPNARRMCVFVSITEDQQLEGLESFTLELVFALPATNAILSPNVTQIFIEDNEVLTIGFDPVEYSILESSGQVSFRIIAFGGVLTSTVVIEFYTTDGTALAVSDYSSTNQSVTFGPGITNRLVSVPVVTDTLLENNETFSGNLRFPSGASSTSVRLDPVVAVATVEDDDGAVIGFFDNYMVIEDVNSTVFLVIGLRDGFLGRDVVVSVSTRDGTAVAPGDYTSFSSLLLTFNSGSLAASIPVTIISDLIVEDVNELFFADATLVSDAPGVLVSPDVSTVDIEDDDELVVGLDRDSYSVLESQEFANITVNMIGRATRNIVVLVQTMDGTAVSIGSERDFVATSRILTFFPSPMALQSIIVPIRIMDDPYLERREMLEGVLSLTVTDPAVLLGIRRASIEIIDNDAVVIGFEQPSYTVNEQAGTLDVAVRIMSGQLRIPIMVNFSTIDGSALAGSDYTGTFQTLTFDRNVARTVLTIPIIDNDVHEQDEAFSCLLSIGSISRVFLNPISTNIVILDNEVVTFTFRQQVQTVVEQVGRVVVFIDRVGSTDTDFELSLNGPLQAESGLRIDRTLVFAATDSEESVSFAVINDNIALEPTESIVWTLTLVTIRDRAGVDPFNTTNILIIDDDELVLSLIPLEMTVPESDNTTAFITFSNPFAQDFIINTSSVFPENVTVPGIASTGVDFLDFPSFVLARQGVNGPSAPLALGIAIVNDNAVEEEQCLSLSISLGSAETDNLLVAISNDTAVYCIQDDDRVSIGFVPIAYFTNEDGLGVELVVQVIAGVLERAVQVFFSTNSGTATSSPPADFVGVLEAPLQFDSVARSRTIRVPILNDDVLENTEFFYGNLTTTDAAVDLTAPGATVTIFQIPGDDIVTVGFQPVNYTFNEVDGFAVLTVVLLQGALERDVTVQFSTTPGTATEAVPRDYRGTTVDLTFTSSVNQTEARVPLLNDTIVEGSEFFFGNLANTLDLVTADPNRANIIITEDTSDRVTIGFDPASLLVNETDGTVTFTIRLLSGTLERSVLVNFFTTDGSATSTVPQDFVAMSNVPLEFSATTSSRQVTVTIINDNILENVEFFYGNLSTSDGAVQLSPATARATILELDEDDVVTIGFMPVDYTVNEVDGYVTLTAVLIQGTLERDVTVLFQTSPGSATSTGARDYEGTTLLFTFTPSVGSNSVNVTIFNDTIVEATESFFGNLAGTAGLVIASPDLATVTIQEDPSDSIVVGFDPIFYTVTETFSIVILTIRQTSGTLERPATVTFSTTDGSATSSAPADFLAVPGLLVVFDQVTNVREVNVTIINDAILEANENFFGNLMTADGAVSLSPASAEVVVQEAFGEDAVIIGFSPQNYSVNEVAGSVTLVVELIQGTLETDVTVPFTTRSGTATEEGMMDYEGTTEILVFTPLISQRSVDVTIFNDNIVEGQEYFTGSINGTFGLVIARPDISYVTIDEDINDRILVGFDPDNYRVNETQGTVTLTISVFDGTLEREAVVFFSTTDGNATSSAPADFTAVSNQRVTFDSSTNTSEVMVAIINDDIVESSEVFFGNLTTGDPAISLSPALAVVDILATSNFEEGVVIGFDPASLSVNETDGTVTFTISLLSGTLERSVLVNFFTTDGSATSTAPQDFVAMSNVPLEFSATTSSRQVTVTIINDNILENAEFFYGNLSTSDGVVQLSPATATVTIQEQPGDDVITVGFSPVNYTVNEADGYVTFSAIIFEGTLERTVTVLFFTTSGTATDTSPADYEMTSQLLTFTPNVNRNVVNVTINNDDIVEGPEEFFGNLMEVPGLVRTDPSIARVEITEDPNDRVTIGFEFPEYFVIEGFEIDVCAVLSSGVLERNAVVMVASRDGTATAGEDYTPVQDVFTFSPTNSSLCVQFNTSDDVILEATEDVQLMLTTSDNMVDLSDPGTTVRIFDNDDIVIGFEQTRFEVNEDDLEKFVELCVAILSGTIETTVVAQLTTVAGTAQATTDYSSLIQTLTFSPMETRFCYNITIVDDRLFESQEQFTANLTTSASSVNVMPGTATIIINDDDELVIGFTRTSDSVREDTPGSIGIFVRVISGVIQGRTVNVAYTTAMSTASNAATSGIDFTPTSGSLEFSSGVTSMAFSVSITDDIDSEGAEVFLAQLTMADDRVILNPDMTTIDILDNEVITIGFIGSPYEANEGDGVATLVVGIILGSLQRDFVVSFTTDDIANVSDAAIATADYQPLGELLTFDSAITILEVNVTLIDDSETETSERFRARLAEVTTGTSASVSPNTAQVTILDNDVVTIGMNRTRVPVNEDVGMVELCASVMSGNLQRDAFVNVVYEDRGAIGGMDYGNSMVLLTFGPDVATTQCFNVPIIDDDDYENAEEFFANLTTSDTQVNLSPTFTVVVISDTDRVVIGWEQPVYVVRESAGVAELCAVASIAGSLQATLPPINIQLTHGSATSPIDFGSSLPSSFLFTRNSPLRQCTNVSIVSDSDFENTTENFFAFLSQSSPSRIDFSLQETEVLITDDDTIVIGFDPESYSASEGSGSVTLGVAVLSGSLDSGVSVEVTFTTRDGSAVTGLDYESVATTLTFTRSFPMMTLRVNITEDTIDEPNELFSAELALVTADSRVVVAPSMASITIIDNDVTRIGFEQEVYRSRENSTIEVCTIVFPPTSLGREVVVSLRTQDDTATAPADYNAITTVLTFSPSILRQCVNFTLPDDEIVEGQERFTVIIDSTDNVTLTPDIAVVEIEEGETILISFEQPAYFFDENDGTVSIVVIKDGESDQAITVRVFGGPSTTPNVVNSAPALNDTVTFNPGEFRKDVTLSLTDDTIALEPVESYIARLSIVTGGDIALTGSPDVTVISVADDDNLMIGFGRPNVTVTENVGTFMMCVVQMGISAVNYNVNIAPQDGTAIAGSDYDSARIPSSVTIRAGEVTACFNSSSILDDTTAETTERFQLRIVSTTPSSSNIIVDRPSTEIIILDNDDDTGGIQVNDTVIGDPLYTVPILVSEEQLQALNMDRVTLCYEVHGESGHWFNLVTDECTSVNTRYSPLSNTLNIMDSVAVRAIDDAMNCVSVRVDVQGCTVAIDGFPLPLLGQYSMNGVSVRRYRNRVRISVPNCQDLTLVMWVICENRMLEDPDDPGVTLTGDMIKFVVMRGLNFGHRQAHGLLGQFWNTRVDVRPFNGNLYDGSTAVDRYVVNITTGNKPRSYTGWMYDLTWDHSEGPCLYVGNRQSGPIGEVTDPNDPVIESLYTSYRVPGAFDEGEDYKFGMFDNSKCSIGVGSAMVSQ